MTEGKSYQYLKVPHHGSKTGLDENLIQQLKPKAAYIPVGENEHDHPAIEILEILRKHGARTFCSSKTKDCRKDCRPGGFGHVCHKQDKEWHVEWTAVDHSKCSNNR